MSSDTETAPNSLENRILLILLVVVTLGLGWILLPYYGTIMWGAIIALLFAPLNRWLLLRLKQRRTLAAMLTLLAVLLMVVLPFALITAALASEAAVVYAHLQSGELNPTQYFRGVFNALPDWISSLLERFGMVNFPTLQRRLSALLSQGSQFIATQALSFGQNTFEFIAGLFITLYLAFFLIRDGKEIARSIRPYIPLPRSHKQDLFDKFTTVIRATVKGTVLVAMIQGALGGFAFWFLGVSGALLGAVLMAFMSLLPAVGAAIVWLPVAVYFLITGAIWQGVALTLYGVLVIGLVDNLLRPVLVGKDTRMPDYVVMITTLGGIAVLGINGFVIGPVIAAMFIAVWHIYGTIRAESQV